MSFYKASEYVVTRHGFEMVEGWRCDEYSGYLMHKIGPEWTVTDIPTGYKLEGGFRTRSEAFKALPRVQEKLNLFVASNMEHYNRLAAAKRRHQEGYYHPYVKDKS